MDYIGQFKNHLILNGLSEKSIEDYCNTLQYIFNELPFENWNQDTINSYLVSKKSMVSPSRMNQYILTISKFLKLQKIDNIELPKLYQSKQTLPVHFTEKFFESELLKAVDLCCKDRDKIRAIFYFMFYTGIRVGEIEHIKRSDFDFSKRQCKIFSPKTNRERIVFFTNKTKEIIEYYFDSEAEDINAFNITKEAVTSIICRIAIYFDNIKLHPHIFRHSFCINLLLNGIDLYTASKLMGHKNIDTTTRYLGLTTEQMQNLYDKKINKRRRKR